jgi:hypothetical protein
MAKNLKGVKKLVLKSQAALCQHVIPILEKKSAKASKSGGLEVRLRN